MTMIPPKIKKLPNLHKAQAGYISKGKTHSSPNASGLYQGGAKMRNS